MGIGANRNAACTCGSGLKYKKCHLPKIMGNLPDGDGGWRHKDTFNSAKELKITMDTIKDSVPDAQHLVIKTVFPYIVMPRIWWEKERKLYGMFNMTDEELDKAEKFKSGFIAARFGVECFLTKYIDGTEA